MTASKNEWDTWKESEKYGMYVSLSKRISSLEVVQQTLDERINSIHLRIEALLRKMD